VAAVGAGGGIMILPTGLKLVRGLRGSIVAGCDRAKGMLIIGLSYFYFSLSFSFFFFLEALSLDLDL